MIVFHKNLNTLTSPQLAIRDSGSECTKRITNFIYNYFASLSSGKYLFWDSNFGHGSWYESQQSWWHWFSWQPSFHFSVMVRWRGRAQGVWPFCGSRGSATYIGVASHHNSHRNGNN